MYPGDECADDRKHGVSYVSCVLESIKSDVKVPRDAGDKVRFTQCLVDAGPALQTMARHQPNTVWEFSVRWVVESYWALPISHRAYWWLDLMALRDTTACCWLAGLLIIPRPPLLLLSSDGGPRTLHTRTLTFYLSRQQECPPPLPNANVFSPACPLSEAYGNWHCQAWAATGASPIQMIYVAPYCSTFSHGIEPSRLLIPHTAVIFHQTRQ